MGYLGRRIGLSQDTGNSSPTASDVGGGILDLFAQGYFNRQGNIYNAPGFDPSGLTASGGVISDYTDGSTIYRAHIFTSTGTFEVDSIGPIGSNIDYLVVGGGGGGGKEGGGGGAGGVRSSHPDTPSAKRGTALSVSASTNYTVTIGAGGVGVIGCPTDGSPAGTDGNGSHFGPGSPIPINTSGGGGGGSKRTNFEGTLVPNANRAGRPGGSGGGAGRDADSAGGGNASTTFPNQLGFAGGDSTADGSTSSGGGGGAGGEGQDNRPSDNAGHGGLGVRIRIAGNPANPSPIGAPGPGSGADGTGWFAGGGGGGGNSGNDKARGGTGPSGAPEPYAGAGQGPSADSPDNEVADSVSNATFATGSGGGGGGWTSPGAKNGGNGGSGFVVVRYQIGTVQSPGSSPKGATGGSISLFNNKVIHTFTSSGSFVAPGPFSETVEYVVVAGGGAGGTGDNGAGGGAGGYKTGTTPISGPSTTTIQVGAGGALNAVPGTSGIDGTDSYFGTPITSTGGGAGGGRPSGTSGRPGGSGGGGAWIPGGASGGTAATGQGYPGGDSHPNTGGFYAAGGGGGAGGQGTDSATDQQGHGGLGVQVPATFRDPTSSVGAPGPTGPVPATNPGGDQSGNYWIAGGGGGGSDPEAGHGEGGGPGGPYAGGGDGIYTGTAESGTQNTGGGGGGTGATGGQGGAGGSGIVIIAYDA